jgi:tetratricopeptide (TPR) repeat protein
MSDAPRASATSSNPSSAPLRDVRVPTWMLPLVLVATLAAMWPSLHGELVYDDLVIVARNPLITSIGQVPKLFSSGLWDFLDPNTAARIGYWRPLGSLTLMLGYAIGGIEPLAYHALSIAFHLAATAAAFLLALRLSRSAPAAFFASLLFGLHPVHVESVAWISAINDPLFGLFALLSLHAFVTWRDRGSSGVAWMSGVWFMLALLSKELAIAVVPITLIIDFARDRERASTAPDRPSNGLGPFRPFARAYGPMLATIGVYYLARVAVFGDWRAGFDRTNTEFGVGVSRLVSLRVELLGGFSWLLAWPRELNLFHPFEPGLAIGDPRFVRAIVCIAVLAAVAWIAYERRASSLLCAALFIPAAVLPALVRVGSLGSFPLSERFLYLATLGFTLLLSAAAFRALSAGLACALLSLVALAYGVRSYERAGVWHDEETLFTDAALHSPKSPYVQWGLGRVLLEKYRAEHLGDTLRRAHAAFERALALLSAAQSGDQTIFATVEDHIQANLGYGWTFLYEAEVDQQHDYETAREIFKRVAERYPLSAEAYTSLGTAYTQLNAFKPAEDAFAKAIGLNARYVEAHHALGVLRMRRGDWKGAADAFEKALELRPDHLDDLLWLARALVQGGDEKRAVQVLDRARDRYPRSAGPLVLRGTLAAQKGDIQGASQYADRATALDPDDADALLLKGKLQLARGEKAGALRTLQRAADLAPTSFEAHYDVAALLLETEGYSAAVPYLLRAYENRPANATGELLHKTLVDMHITNTETLCRLASIDAGRSNDAQAAEWLEHALEVDPKSGPAHFLKGMLAQKRGDREAALDEWRKACDAMPDSAQAHESLGMLLFDMKRRDDALPWLEKALAIATRTPPTDDEQRAAIDMLREAIERVKNAR